MLNHFDTVVVEGQLTADAISAATISAIHNIATELANGANPITINPILPANIAKGMTLAFDDDTGGSASWKFPTVLGYGNGSSGVTIETEAAPPQNSILSVVDSVNKKADWVSKIVDEGDAGNFYIGKTTAPTSSGSYNVCVGTLVLTQMPGEFNVVFGYSCLNPLVGGNRNVVVGSSALEQIEKEASDNVCVGSNPLQAVSNVDSCVAIGSSAGSTGYFHDTLKGCIFLGAFTDSDAYSLQNATAIGYNALVSTSDSMTLGSGVNVGINQSSPVATLQISTNQNGVASLQIDNSTTTPTAPTDTNVILFNQGGLLTQNKNGTDVLLMPNASENRAPAVIYGIPYLNNSSVDSHTFGTADLTPAEGVSSVEVPTTYVSADSKIMLSRSTMGADPGFLAYSITPGVSFTITSSNILDNGSINWFILNGNF